MSKQRTLTYKPASVRSSGHKPAAVVVALCSALILQGCFDPIYPQRDREERVMEALQHRDALAIPPSPLTPSDAVVYALANNLDSRAAEIEIAYHSEAAVAARRRLLPNLNVRYSMEHSNHPSARWSKSTKSGNESLESSYSSDPDHRQGEVSLMWNILDFGVGYLKSRQQGEKIRHSAENYRRVRQQVVLDVLSHYWRTSAAVKVAAEAEALREEMESQARAVRDSVDMRILSGAEGARRELTIHAGLAELEQWRRVAGQARLDLARVLGCGTALGYTLQEFPEDIPDISPFTGDDPSALQTAALKRRPELFQQDAQERVAVDEARLALLQMVPNANLSLGFYDDPDKFLEWSNWMTVGARVSWNLFNIPARVSEKRMANLQEKVARDKGLALAAAIMAQVGIAYSEWKVSHEFAATLARRTAARERLVEALAAGESDGQTRPGEVLQERVRLLADRAATLRALAEARVAGARLANAIGLDVDDQGRLLWQTSGSKPVDLLAEGKIVAKRSRIRHDEAIAATIIPATVPGMKVVMAEDFEAPAEYFLESARKVKTEASIPKKLAVNPPSPKHYRAEQLPAATESPDASDAASLASEPFDDVAQINRWAAGTESDGAFFPPPPTEKAPAAPAPAKPAPRGAKPLDLAKADPKPAQDDGRLVPAAQLRTLYKREKEDPKWLADSPSKPAPARDIMEIPGIGVDDFTAAEARRLKNPEAWKTPNEAEILAGPNAGFTATEPEWKPLNQEELQELYSTGLVSREDALWTATAKALEPLKPLSAPVRASGGGNSLRPPPMTDAANRDSVSPDGEFERKRALTPLQIIGPDAAPAFAKPEDRPLRPPGANGQLARL